MGLAAKNGHASPPNDNEQNGIIAHSLPIKRDGLKVLAATVGEAGPAGQHVPLCHLVGIENRAAEAQVARAPIILERAVDRAEVEPSFSFASDHNRHPSSLVGRRPLRPPVHTPRGPWLRYNSLAWNDHSASLRLARGRVV
jgi:hypothetical protein